MVVFYILIPVLILFSWIIFVPVWLNVDTRSGQYEMRQLGTFRLSLHPTHVPAIRLTVIGLSVPIGGKPEREPRKPVKKKSGWRLKRSRDAWRYLVRGILRSLHVKKFILEVDVGDVVINALLVPAVMLVNRGVVFVATNFDDRNFLVTRMQVRVNRIVWTFLRFLTKK